MKNWKPLKIEELSKDTQKVYDVLNKESDLACVLIGTSYLSEMIAGMLETVFVKTDIAKKILNPQFGAIGGFMARADLARCLGLVDKKDYQDLKKVAEIRNLFAHRHIALNFGNNTVQKACEDLQVCRFLRRSAKERENAKATKEQLRITARSQFTTSIVLLSSPIHLKAVINKGKKEL